MRRRNPAALARALKRVTLTIRTKPITDAELVSEIAVVDQALVIVNSRRHALALYRAAKAAKLSGVIHLTTRQTAADRRRILAAIRDDLKSGRPCRVIATSLVEAGVDLDFPRVWRAQAGLDQIAQAAGRCNREGGRSVADSIVTVFTPVEGKPPPEIRPFIEATQRVIPYHDDLLSPEAVQRYFNEVYWQRGEKHLDQITVRGLDGATEKMSVLDALARFRLPSRDPCGSADRNIVVIGVAPPWRVSLPVRERGSKHRIGEMRLIPSHVAPRAGARIETAA
jgi:CRISPR-associated endonuclease/helicase Cas3